ncbi:MAG: GNAT family N-acetyltransferase [Planctomycetota bacterium]
MPPTVRPATRDDHAFVARLFPDLGAGDPMPALDPWAAERLGGTTIAELDGAPAGFLFAQSEGGDGYVRHVVVAPDARRRGVARALLDAFADQLRASGRSRWRLNVRPENTAAVALYRTLGMEVEHASVALDFTWSWVRDLPDPHTQGSAREPDASELDALSGRFGIAPGVLERGLRSPASHVRVLGHGEPTALCTFDPAFPGCFPFRAVSFDAAVALLRAIEPLATQDAMRVVVEDDAALDAAFVAAGAREHLRFVHMAGPVPAAP